MIFCHWSKIKKYVMYWFRFDSKKVTNICSCNLHLPQYHKERKRSGSMFPFVFFCSSQPLFCRLCFNTAFQLFVSIKRMTTFHRAMWRYPPSTILQYMSDFKDGLFLMKMLFSSWTNLIAEMMSCLLRFVCLPASCLPVCCPNYMHLPTQQPTKRGQHV